MKINDSLIVDNTDNFVNKFKPCDSLGFGNTKQKAIQDKALKDAGIYDLLQSKEFVNAPSFLGYGILSNLAQDGLIRAGVEMRADEMTRRFIDFDYIGEGKDEHREAVEQELKRLHAEKVFREAVAMCGYFGGCLVYLDTGDLTADELRLPIGDDVDTLRKIRSLKLIEPFNVAPCGYTCFSPLDRDYFQPQSWLIQGREIHASRFLYFSEGKPPTLLLPSYNFFGIPLAQTVADVVMSFKECRQSAARLLKKFSLTIFKTDMSDVFNGGLGKEVQKRVAIFAKKRDNDGIMLIDQQAEDIIGIATPLGGVTDIVRQQMEIVAAYFGEPSVKLWGISPNGFNATGQSDMMSHYDHIHAIQEQIMREPLQKLIKLVQIAQFGEVDENLVFEFRSLSDEDEAIKAGVQKTKADTAAVYFDRGIIDGAECRKALSEDPASGFCIDLEKEIEQGGEIALPLEIGGGIDENLQDA